MKRCLISSILEGLILFCANLSFSATIDVPGDSATIQAGINGAVNGDTVLVADGTYIGDGNRDIDFGGKSVVVMSENGPEYTIVDCQDNLVETHRGFHFHSGEDSAAVIDGFTIKNGLADFRCGGGILCQNSSPTIKNCYLMDNQSLGAGPIPGRGGGMFCDNSSPTLESCVFRNNIAGETQGAGGGGGICCLNSSPNLKNCTFFDNGIALLGIGSALLSINSSPMFENCIVAFNRSYPVFCYQYKDIRLSNPTFICSDIYGNESGDWVDCITDQADLNGNFSADPLFCDTANGDFTIKDISPCAPANNECGVLIGAYDVGCDAILSYVGFLDEDSSNVTNHIPTIYWVYYDADPFPNDSFQVAVGTDEDWEYAEMWNPAPFESSDTFVVYNGSPLIDGESYFLRLKVRSNGVWSFWYEISFRMNSVPSIPVPLSPIDDEVTNNTPILWIENSIDAEGDPITYDFSGFHDTDCVLGPNIDIQGVVEETDSTGGQVIDPLGENCIYWWKARAFDGYEYSDWSTTQRFYIDGTSEPPTDFQIQYPPDTSGWYVFDMLSNFFWEPSYDYDPYDSVYYTLYLSLDSNFTFVSETDSIWQAWYAIIDSLEFGTQYWWKVKATDNTGLFTYSSNILDFKTWKLGDANGDWKVDIFDVTFLIAYLYLEGPAPWAMIMGDINGDCMINIFDVIYLIAFLYMDSPAPLVGCE